MSIESAIKAIHAAGLSDTDGETTISNYQLRRIVELALSEQWEPIESAPKDETPILAWISSKWVEGMFWNRKEWSYLSDADITPIGKFQPKYWKPFPQSPEVEA